MPKLRLPKKQREQTKILFVCTGNTCRSPMAEAIAQEMIEQDERLSKYFVDSAGLSINASSKTSMEAIDALEKHGIHRVPKPAKLLTRERFEWADHIYTMTYDQEISVAQKFGSAGKAPALHCIAESCGFEISDPYGCSRSVYERTADQLELAVKRIFQDLDLLK